MLLPLLLCNGGNACHCHDESVYDFLVHGEDGKVLPSILMTFLITSLKQYC
jgi:hypothetical protein